MPPRPLQLTVQVLGGAVAMRIDGDLSRTRPERAACRRLGMLASHTRVRPSTAACLAGLVCGILIARGLMTYIRDASRNPKTIM